MYPTIREVCFRPIADVRGPCGDWVSAWASYMLSANQGGGVDKNQLLRERDRLQAVLDGYNRREPTVGRHVSLMERIANLDSRLAQTNDA